LSIELKSVNSRFLDLAFRMPEELRALEPVLRERISARVQRGKLECRMTLASVPGRAPKLALNPALLDALADASRRVQAAVPGSTPLSVGEVLHWPGMLAEDAGSAEKLHEGALALFNETLAEFATSRSREGAKLRQIIEERVGAMNAVLARVKPMLPEAVAAYQEKITARLREALAGADEDRIRQEMALFGIKFDVAEELSRLDVHLAEVMRVLAAGGAAGRRLDFLMQELNREANTLGSKAISREVSDAVVELKIFIEQMREQVQNIE
jgi:uncharacterized protein (TIGR00255 family)